MSRRMLGSCVLILAMMGVPVGNPVASQSLTKCTARTQRLTLAKPRSGVQKVQVSVNARSTIDYHVAKLKADANLEIKLTNPGLTFEIYSLEPSTKITKNVNWWAGTLYSGKKYVLVVNNCAAKVTSRNQLEIAWK